MKTWQAQPNPVRRAFTMVELLTVIAIIAILAALIFPVFGAVREQARQSSTMSNMQSIYVATRLFYEDEQRYPSVLFGYAQSIVPNSTPPAQAVAKSTNEQIVSMADTRQNFQTASGTVNKGYLYGEQVKSVDNFFSADNLETNQAAVTIAYYPRQVSDLLGLPFPSPVVWKQTGTNGVCQGDADLPDSSYIGENKLYYVKDSMDIGPLLDADGKWMTDNGGNKMYELHYSPNWTSKAGVLAGDVCSDVDSSNNPILRQLKYKNPPTDKTVITYVTSHVATSGSPNVIVLFLNGSARKINKVDAYNRLPLNY